MRRWWAALALGLGLAACGNANVVTANDITQRYVTAVAEGDFPGACALLTPATQSALTARAGAHRGCAELLDHCLPNSIRVASADKSQLLYVNLNLVSSGADATVTLTGLPVAAALRRVTLRHQHGRWRLTTPGQAVARCVNRLHARQSRSSHG